MFPENSSSAQDYTGSPDVISELILWCFLTQTQRDLGDSTGCLPGLQGISKEATRRKCQWHSIWWGFFLWAPAVACIAIIRWTHNIHDRHWDEIL